VLLPLYAHFSRPFWTGQPLAYPAVQKSGAAAKSPAAFDRNQVPVCSDFCILDGVVKLLG
jgi:hypothetical protein